MAFLQGDKVKCYRFSDVACVAQKQCCNNMSLRSALDYHLKCITCKLRKDIPAGAIPIFPSNSDSEIHLSNNHLVVCVICSVRGFRQVWGQENVRKHVTECIIRATMNASRPYICTNCLQTIWLKPQEQ